MRTEKEIKKKIDELTKKKIQFSGRNWHGVRYEINLQIRMLEWVLEDKK